MVNKLDISKLLEDIKMVVTWYVTGLPLTLVVLAVFMFASDPSIEIIIVTILFYPWVLASFTNILYERYTKEVTE